MAPRLSNDKKTDALTEINYDQNFNIVVTESVQLQLAIHKIVEEGDDLKYNQRS